MTTRLLPRPFLPRPFLHGIALKTVRDRWKAWAVAAAALGAMLWWAMSLYSQIDLSLYTSMPDALLAMMNIPADADAGGLAYGAIYSSYGALTLAALALAMGASAVAGEERDGTLGLLLANPRSRTAVVASKAAAMVLLVALGALVLWAAARAAPVLTGVSIAGMHPGALVLHMAVNAVFYGFLALALGAWTGRVGTAAGVTTLVMLVSWLASGLFPVIEGWGDAARAFPWYYYDAGLPVFNGVDAGDLAVLGVGAVVFAAAAAVGVNRRDLRNRSVGESVVDRLRGHRMTRAVVGRLAGSARVSGIGARTVSEFQGLVIVTGYVMFLVMGVLMGPVYRLMDQALLSFARDLPESLLAMTGQADMSTPEGFYQSETFSMTAPIALILLTVVMGARALAGEEAHHTMGLLLANPVPRSRVVLEKAAAMTVNAALVGVATGAGVLIGSWIAGLGMPVTGIAAASLLVTLVGLVFGGLALLAGAATGRVRTAYGLASGLALATYLLNAFLPLNESLAGYARWSPFYYYLGGDPLSRGLDWGHAALLAGVFVALVAAATVAFGRRDLRLTG